jgi:hypothetical protein
MSGAKRTTHPFNSETGVLPDFASDPPQSHPEHGMVRTLTLTE